MRVRSIWPSRLIISLPCHPITQAAQVASQPSDTQLPLYSAIQPDQEIRDRCRRYSRDLKKEIISPYNRSHCLPIFSKTLSNPITIGESGSRIRTREGESKMGMAGGVDHLDQSALVDKQIRPARGAGLMALRNKSEATSWPVWLGVLPLRSK
jgi:hypothetical protein